MLIWISCREPIDNHCGCSYGRWCLAVHPNERHIRRRNRSRKHDRKRNSQKGITITVKSSKKEVVYHLIEYYLVQIRVSLISRGKEHYLARGRSVIDSYIDCYY